MLKKIGTMKISRKTSALVNDWIEVDKVDARIGARSTGVVQAHDSTLRQLGLDGLPNDVQLPADYSESPCFLAFRDVVKHNDDWEQVRYKKRDVAPAFWHVVLKGRATIKMGRKKLDVKKGDVFVMNPNIDHEVTSSSFCTTLVTTVPKLLYTKVPEI